MSEYRKTMLRLFKDKRTPTMFLSSMAEKTVTRAQELEIDMSRGNETYAVDITPGAGSRKGQKKKFTTKTFTPPMYDQSGTLSAQELMNRLPGQTAYEAADEAFQAVVLSYVTDIQGEEQDKIIRAIELQARDALFNGSITLHDGSEIDFKKKATHDITPAVKWSAATGTPVDDISDGAILCRKDGKVGGNLLRLVVAEDSLAALLSNPDFVEKGDLRHVDRVKVNGPSDLNEDGAAYHGTFSAGSYKVELWTYPQYYTVPTGYGLSDEGTDQPYIPNGKALLIPPNIDFRLVFGGIPTIIPTQVSAELEGVLGGLPAVMEADFHPYQKIDWQLEVLEAGVKSRPLVIPAQIDGFVTFNTLV